MGNKMENYSSDNKCYTSQYVYQNTDNEIQNTQTCILK